MDFYSVFRKSQATKRKKYEKMLLFQKKVVSLQTQNGTKRLQSLCVLTTRRLVQWCNGSTPDFGSVSPGSNPGWTTRKAPIFGAFLVVSGYPGYSGYPG